MKTIDVKFNEAAEFATGASANRYIGKVYAYLVTDAQAQRIIDDKIEFAVVAAPGGAGALKVVKIVGQPSDTPERATRYIIDVVDFKAYEQAQMNADKVKRIRAQINERAKELAEEARLKALASGDPTIAALLTELEALKV